MGKLEEIFNLPEEIEDLENKANRISDSLKDDKENTEIDNLLQEFQTTLSKDDLSAIVDLKNYDKDMDTIAEKTLTEFDDLMLYGKDVESRVAGEIFSAAAQMAKISLDAKTNKVNARLKIMELSIKRKRNELLEQKQNSTIGESEETETKSLTRDDILKIAEEMKKKG